MDNLSERAESLVQIIQEEEFLPFVQNSCREIFKIHNSFRLVIEDGKVLTRKFYSHLVQAADGLESFLDEHGARENKRWAHFAEYIASIRNLSISAFYIRHLLDRYPFYNLKESEADRQIFYDESQKTLEFLNNSILNLFFESLSEGKKNGLQISEDEVNPDEFPEVQRNKQLPKNYEEDQAKGEEERVIDWCEKVKRVARMIREVNIGKVEDPNILKKAVPGSINEETARMYANLIHNVQSDFDSYIKNTRIADSHPQLKNIRGYISVALHLQEIVLWLTHFYERHEDGIRKSTVKSRISKVVDKNILLSCVLNYAFYFSLDYIQKGEALSIQTLTEAMEIVSYELPIPKPHGFHARPSTYLSLIAREHNKDVYLVVDDEKYNVKSVMSLLQAGGVIADKGYQVIRFEGDKRTLGDIRVLAESNYCENMKIPPQLSYLQNLNKV
tara:strand:- start:2305 stop:3639 length:1335 start_codon:yes stop_codon:yes gene_type:complete